MPETLEQPIVARRRPAARRQRRLRDADHDNPVFCSRDQDFVSIAGLIDAVQATGKDIGGMLMKLIRPASKK